MSRKMVGVVVSVVAVAVIATGIIAFSLYGGGSSPDEAIAAVIQKVEELKTFAFTMDMELETFGQSMTMEFEGSAEDNANPAAAKVDMTGSMSVLGQSITMSEVLMDGKLYLKYDPDPLGAESQWYFMDYDLSGMQTANQGSGNPAEYLEFMKAYSSVESKGTETINDIKCNHYYLVIDGAKIADMATANYEEMMKQMPEGTTEGAYDAEQARAMYEDAEITADLYVGVDDGMPHRQVVNMGLKSPVPMDMTISMDMFDFNKPVDIKAPAGAVPLPVELGGTSSPTM